MKYCHECGTKLIEKPLENEGIIPYCEKCGQYRFPIFSAAVSMIVHDPEKTRILLIQQYGKPSYVLVAGYINKGESAEAAVIREVREETGLTVTSLHFNKSEYFERSNTLMFNYTCVVDSDSLEGLNTTEIDKADWFGISEAPQAIRKNSLAEKFLLYYLENRE